MCQLMLYLSVKLRHFQWFQWLAEIGRQMCQLNIGRSKCITEFPTFHPMDIEKFSNMLRITKAPCPLKNTNNDRAVTE